MALVYCAEASNDAYVPGPSGEPSDLVLRQTADPSRGFAWKGQEDYDRVGAAVLADVRAKLESVCALERIELAPPPGAPPRAPRASVFRSRGARAHAGPLLLLVCGKEPGGAAGVWGRSLCINDSTRTGAMFDYVLRARALGWAVVVADPNVSDERAAAAAAATAAAAVAADADAAPTRAPAEEPVVPGSETPHAHVTALWAQEIAPARASVVLVVAHSYGAPATVAALKTLDAAQAARLGALALTDGFFQSGAATSCASCRRPRAAA